MTAPSSPPPRPTIAPLASRDLVIDTPRLRLRPFRDDDVEDLWPFVSDPALSAMMSWSAHVERAQTLAFIRHVRGNVINDTGLSWAIELGGRVVGCVGLEGLMFQVRAWRVDRGELGFWIAPPLWNQGLTTEAATAALRFGFETIGLHKVTVNHLVENTGSRRVIEKLGFHRIGQSDDDVWRDGRWWSVVRYELTCAAWLDRPG